MGYVQPVIMCYMCHVVCRSDDGRNSSELDAVDRATTAPAKPVRRNWLANSINLKTSRGDQLKIRVPSKLMVSTKGS